MTRSPAADDRRRRLRLQSLLSLLVVALGAVLLVYMVVVESEPGALPLGLLAAGIAWYASTRIRLRTLTSR